MNNGVFLAQHRSYFYYVLIVYILAGFALLPFFRYQINPDGISYICIAEKYFHGDFKNAVNGHFSPLFCWLLLPFLYCGLDQLLAAKLLNLINGIATFFLIRWVSYRFHIVENVRTAIYLSLIPVLLYFALYLITPDLLLSNVLLLYFGIIFRDNYAYSRSYCILLGIVGGIAYLTKSYCFPFFIVHFTLFNILYYCKTISARDRLNLIFNFLMGSIIFLIISGVWISTLSYKYGEFTISTQTAHNYQGISPEPPPRYGLIPPPSETAISVWEDPYVMIDKISWTPFKSWSAFRHWLKFFVGNILPTIKIFNRFSTISLFLCLGYLLYLAYDPRRIASDYQCIHSLLTIIIYSAGYCLILVDERYLWVVCLLFMLTAGHILSKIFQEIYFISKRSNIVLGIFIISFSILPCTKIFKEMNTGKGIYHTSQSLKKYIPEASLIASNGDFYNSLFLAYHLKLKYFGTSEILDPEYIDKELDKYKINYFIEWRNPKYRQQKLMQFKAISELQLNGMPFTVYKRFDSVP